MPFSRVRGLCIALILLPSFAAANISQPSRNIVINAVDVASDNHSPLKIQVCQFMATMAHDVAEDRFRTPVFVQVNYVGSLLFKSNADFKELIQMRDIIQGAYKMPDYITPLEYAKYVYVVCLKPKLALFP